MNIKYLIFPLLAGLLATHATLASKMERQPGDATTLHAAPKVLSVMSMGKVEAIDAAAGKLRINGVEYSFETSGRLFVNASGAPVNAAQIKVGDWVHFWIKASTAQHMPQVERVELLVNPELRKAKP